MTTPLAVSLAVGVILSVVVLASALRLAVLGFLRGVYRRAFAAGRADAFGQVAREVGLLAHGCALRRDEKEAAGRPGPAAAEETRRLVLLEVEARFADLIKHPMAGRKDPTPW